MADVVKSFNSELVSLYEIKPPISKKKIVDITKAAMKAIKYYKHVVMGVEKFIQKCKAEYKVPGLYVIDSIVRQSRHQFGAEKDVFGPRFTTNIETTIDHLLGCPDPEKPKIVRVLNLWLKNVVFPEVTVKSLLDACRAKGLVIEAVEVERAVKGDAANLSLYGKTEISSPMKECETPPPPPTTTTIDGAKNEHEQIDLTPKISSEMQISERDMMEALKGAGLDPVCASDPHVLQQIQQLTNALLVQQKQEQQDEQRTGTIKSLLAREFDYSDESDEQDSLPTKVSLTKANTKKDLTAAANDLLRNPSVIAQIQQLQRQRVCQEEESTDYSPAPAPTAPAILHSTQNNLGLSTDHSMTGMNRGRDSFDSVDKKGKDIDERERGRRMDGGSSSRRRQRDKRSSSRDKERSYRKRSKRSRSGDRNRDGDRDERKYRAERRRAGLPSVVTPGRLLVASRTIWLGRLPENVSDGDIKLAFAEYGQPEKINIVRPRACAYVTMPDRRSAFKIIDRLFRNLYVAKKPAKLNWAKGPGMNAAEYDEFWDIDRGISLIPYDRLADDLLPLLDGGHLDVDTLPSHLKGLYTERGKIGVPLPDPRHSQAEAAAMAPMSETVPAAITAFPPMPFPMPPGMPAFPFPPPFIPGMPPPTMPPFMSQTDNLLPPPIDPSNQQQQMVTAVSQQSNHMPFQPMRPAMPFEASDERRVQRQQNRGSFYGRYPGAGGRSFPHSRPFQGPFRPSYRDGGRGHDRSEERQEQTEKEEDVKEEADPALAALGLPTGFGGSKGTGMNWIARQSSDTA